MVVNNQPVDQADIRLYNGDQRQGKSTAAMASAVDDSYEQMTALVSPDGVITRARGLVLADKAILEKAGRRANVVKYARVFSDDGSESKLVEIPKGYTIQTPVKIFANFHIYGLPNAAFVSLVDIVENMNTLLFNNSWILLDDAGTTNSRRSMEGLGKLGGEFYLTIGKRHAHLCVMSQYVGAIEKWLRLAQTTLYQCTYDKQSKYITVDVTRRGEPQFSTEFWAPTYWPFFDTDEIVKTLEGRIDKAVAPFYK